ncbi:hypothetical protein TNCV_4546321 [Trichonephila clavipes]|nr:hypothetical protein TNCV_4546321 [Trichonephila clavipes]
MSRKSPSAIHIALKGIGGEPRSIKSCDSMTYLSIIHLIYEVNIFSLDLLCASEAEILEELDDPSHKLPSTIISGYLNCKIHPYITDHQRCFKCQTFRHSQTSCHGHLTCSRCASVGHSSMDSTQELCKVLIVHNPIHQIRNYAKNGN